MTNEWDNPDIDPDKPKKVEPYSHRPVIERILREHLPEEEFDFEYDPGRFGFTVTRKGDGAKIEIDKEDIYLVAPEELSTVINNKFQEAENGTGTF